MKTIKPTQIFPTTSNKTIDVHIGDAFTKISVSEITTDQFRQLATLTKTSDIKMEVSFLGSIIITIMDK